MSRVILFGLVRLFVLVFYHPHFLLSTHVIEFKGVLNITWLLLYFVAI